MKQRPSARLLVVNDEGCVLLFRFEHKSGALAGDVFWATPGGAVDDGESFEDAGRRELFEEVGLTVDDLGPQIAQRIAIFAAPSGEMVEADERYFLVRAPDDWVSNAHWTELEREVMAAHQWWTQADLLSATEQIWPEDLAAMLISARLWPAA